MTGLRFAVLALAAVTPSVALAEGGFVDQVEGLEIEQGEFEIEGQFIFVNGDGGEDALLSVATFEYGLSDSFQIGLEIEAELEKGEAFIVEAIGLQFKWAAIDPGDGPIGLGIQFAGVVVPQTGDFGIETYLIVESDLGGVNAAANLVVETEPGDFSEVSTAYALRMDHDLSERLTLGVEAGGGISGDGRGSHFFGPVASISLSDDAALELSAFAPLSEEAPGLQLRMEIDLAF